MALAVPLLLAGLLAGLLGCGPRAGARAEAGGAAGEDDYERGLAAWRAGRADAAIAAFERYVGDEGNGSGDGHGNGGDGHGDAAPANAEAAHYYLTLAQVARADCGAARLALGALARRHPRSNLLEDARAAVLACKPGAPGGAGAAARLDRPGAQAALDAALAGGDGFHAVVYANRVVVLGGTLAAEARARVAVAVDELPPRLVEDAWTLVDPRAWPAPLLAYRRVRLALHRGELGRARELLVELAGSGDATLAAAATDAVLAAERRARVAPEVVGVLLPLSGTRAALGRELRLGIELAAAEHKGVQLVFVDTGGDETRAAQAVDDLVEKQHPIAILGPVGERESAAAVARALALGVPIALLTPTEGLADARAGVFTLWSSGEDRARLAAQAAAQLGYEAPAVLTPRDDGGRAQAAAFADESAALGHPVIATGEYDPTGADLEPDVKAFLGLDPLRNARLRAHLKKHRKDGWKTFSPDVGFDVLFVPDTHDRAALIVAFLVYFNVELRTSDAMDSAALARKHGGRPPSFVRLLGASGWNHPDLGLRGGADIEWALVVDVFFAAETLGDVAADFVERFGARGGRAPSALAAQAYDAARLLLGAHARVRAALAQAPETGAREALRAALAGASLADGACGPARVDARGELVRGGVLLRVEGGELVVQELLEPPAAGAP